MAVVRLLLRAGATLELRNESLKTPLFESCSGGQAAVALLLLEAGANVNAGDAVRGFRPCGGCWSTHPVLRSVPAPVGPHRRPTPVWGDPPVRSRHRGRGGRRAGAARPAGGPGGRGERRASRVRKCLWGATLQPSPRGFPTRPTPRAPCFRVTVGLTAAVHFRRRGVPRCTTPPRTGTRTWWTCSWMRGPILTSGVTITRRPST